MTEIRYFTNESASCELVIWDEEHAAVSNLYAKQLGKGHASGLLNKITSFADENSLRLVLIAEPFDNDGLSLFQLIQFYRKFDFVSDSDPEKATFMERIPH